MSQSSVPLTPHGRAPHDDGGLGGAGMETGLSASQRLTRAIASLPPWARSQGMRFAAVGSSGVIVNIGVLSVLYTAFHWPLLTSIMCAAEVAMVSNYVWHECWTFGGRQLSLGRLAAFNISSLTGMVVATTATVILVTGGLPSVPADLLGVLSGAGCTFSLSKVWVWKAAS